MPGRGAENLYVFFISLGKVMDREKFRKCSVFENVCAFRRQMKKYYKSVDFSE